MAEGPGASWTWELVGAEEGLTAGVAGAMAGEESRCSISLIFLEAPRVLDDFLRLYVAFFLKRAKCISTGIRQINETMSENKKLTLWGGALENIPMAFFFSASRAAVLFLEAPPSVFFFLPPSAASEVELFRFRANGASSLETTVTSFIFGS